MVTSQGNAYLIIRESLFYVTVGWGDISIVQPYHIFTCVSVYITFCKNLFQFGLL